MTLIVYLQAGTALLPLPANLDPMARQLAGWDTLAAQLDAMRRATGADFVATDQYGVAAELARALPRDTTMIGTDPRWTTTDLPRAAVTGHVGILIRRDSEPDDIAWSNPTEIGEARRQRGDDTVETFRVYRVIAPDIAAAAVTLPRPVSRQ
jgi:hypothetical protein